MELTKVDLEKIKQAQNEYHKEWSEKNKEKIRKYHKEWREKNKDKIKKYTKTYWLKKIQEREEKL